METVTAKWYKHLETLLSYNHNTTKIGPLLQKDNAGELYSLA